MSLGVGFEVSEAQTRLSSSLFLLPRKPDEKLLLQCHVPTCRHTSHCGAGGLNLGNCKQPQLKLYFLRVAEVMVSPHSNTTLTKTATYRRNRVFGAYTFRV